MVAHLAEIRLFPIKSLDPAPVSEAVVTRTGRLRHDREYCLLDEDGKAVNTKRVGEALARIRAEVDFGFGEITLREGGCEQVFHLNRDRAAIEDWFSRRLGLKVTLAHDPENGFPDDTDASGPTVVSTASLAEVASWFPGISLEEMRRRVRANLEVDGVPPFWEDRLYGPEGDAKPFRIGEVLFEGVKPCARCAVPSRDSYTGRIERPDFAKIFAEKRQETLPAWAERSRFNHFYRLAVNTRIPPSEAGKLLRTLDEVTWQDPEWLEE